MTMFTCRHVYREIDLVLSANDGIELFISMTITKDTGEQNTHNREQFPSSHNKHNVGIGLVCNTCKPKAKKALDSM